MHSSISSEDDELHSNYEFVASKTTRLVGFFTMLRESQRYGVMMVPTLPGRDRETAVRLAALFLLQQVTTDFRPASDIASDWMPRQGSKLRHDAENLASLFDGQQAQVQQFWSQAELKAPTA